MGPRPGPSRAEAKTNPLRGRRKGRPLRPGRQALLDELLPRLEVDLEALGGDPAALFEERPRALWLEIGFGGGEHLAWQAETHPDVGLIGVEVFINGIASLLRHVAERGLANIRIHRGDGRAVLAVLPDNALERIFILFPDPWPKKKHHKRRLVNRPVLDEIARVLMPGGELRLATDDPDYQSWMLERLGRHRAFAWLAEGPADWRARCEDWPQSRYEEKAIAAGRRPLYLRYRRREPAESA